VTSAEETLLSPLSAAASLAEEYWKKATLVCGVIRPLPGNAVAHFTAPVMLMILLPQWFIQVTIHQISRNFTDARIERGPRFQMM
jgi:hypothetical protein